MILLRAVNISMELWGFLICVLIVIYILHEDKPLHPRSRALLHMALCQGAILLFDMMSYICEGNPTLLCRRIIIAANFLIFLLAYLLLVLFTRYMQAYLQGSGPVSSLPLTLSRLIALIGTVLLIAAQYNHMYYVINADNIYVRGPLFALCPFMAILGMVINAIALLVYNKRIAQHDRVVIWIYILLPVAAMAIQSFVYGLALMNFANTAALLILYLFVQMNYKRQAQLQREQLLKQKAELAQTRMDLMRSQIQPHFIYNTLGTIGELCLTRPEKAAEVVNDFSHYLRGNFDELESSTPIRLSREIEHVKHYAAIERVRFPDMDVRYDLRSSEFLLPALSIQPLVENAIKHGLMGLESGGCVVISSFETDSDYCVRVRDNGVGFDPSAPPPSRGRRHLGIANIRERVAIMCGGTLTIESAPGRGTTALISIPKEDEK